MAERASERTGSGLTAPWAAVIHTDDTREFSRIWQGFMTARFTLGLVLVAMQITLLATGPSHTLWLLFISLAYFASTLTTGLFGKPLFLGNRFNRHWIRLVGLDVLAFSTLQILQGNPVNYTPLFALPILLASVLGSLRLALGTAAGVTMLMLGSTFVAYMAGSADATVSLLQAALSGAGFFAVALLANQLSRGLSIEGKRARSNQAAATLQRQVNELVIESLPEGVLIVDRQGSVRAANPAALRLLTANAEQRSRLTNLHHEPGWQPLVALTDSSLAQGAGQREDVTIRHEGQGPRRIRVSTRPTNPQDLGGESLCVLFLQDQRELEARMRTEKLASMGRMSTAVAHEIRNPLAAISQANALLEEELTDPRHQRLTHMVSQNAQRLAKIVDDILDASRAQPQDGGLTPLQIALNETASRICRDWSVQNHCAQRLQCGFSGQSITVQFEGDHLRRILVNLLDNARRFASDKAGGIQVQTEGMHEQYATLRVWSEGPSMDQTVERHLFEPFFSSESRSSGLGLYICRELCEGHGATIAYQRASREVAGAPAEGNEFSVSFVCIAQTTPAEYEDSSTSPWPITTF
jgi:two-component system sensor histidine kinase PilS (NtrC family)